MHFDRCSYISLSAKQNEAKLCIKLLRNKKLKEYIAQMFVRSGFLTLWVNNTHDIWAHVFETWRYIIPDQTWVKILHQLHCKRRDNSTFLIDGRLASDMWLMNGVQWYISVLVLGVVNQKYSFVWLYKSITSYSLQSMCIQSLAHNLTSGD
jgi:hypothetical protein